MARKLTSNVHVEGKWYGPDYPQNEVTPEVLDQITNEYAFADPGDGANVGAGPDNRFRHDDFGDQAPPLREQEAETAAAAKQADTKRQEAQAKRQAAAEAPPKPAQS